MRNEFMSAEDPQIELKRLRTIFQNANDAIFLIDITQDKILDANNRALQLLGYSKEEILKTLKWLSCWVICDSLEKQ